MAYFSPLRQACPDAFVILLCFYRYICTYFKCPFFYSKQYNAPIDKWGKTCINCIIKQVLLLITGGQKCSI